MDQEGRLPSGGGGPIGEVFKSESRSETPACPKAATPWNPSRPQQLIMSVATRTGQQYERVPSVTSILMAEDSLIGAERALWTMSIIRWILSFATLVVSLMLPSDVMLELLQPQRRCALVST